jgi:predicted TIM-barrel fold metal-dependent hydrolase
VLAGRLRNLADGGELPEGIDAELQRLHYETGNAASRATLAALLALVPESKVLFGSDHPYVSIATNLADMTGAGLPAATLAAIERENALRIIPGLAG